MRVFVTGASGFIGRAVVAELSRGGHEVAGLARSEAAAAALVAVGARAHRGDLRDAASLRAGAEAAEGVVHLAFNHEVADVADFARFCEDDRRVVEALADGLAGTGRPLLVTSGVATVRVPGRPAAEDDAAPALAAGGMPRAASEEAALAAAARGVAASIVRLPQVPDPEKQGLITWLVDLARERGVSSYVGEGENRWSAVHVDDAARLYRAALERGATGERYHAVGEEGVPFRAIAEAVGRRLGLPARSIEAGEAAERFGWLAHFVDADLSASSAKTRETLAWRPTGPGLIADVERRPAGVA